jgi:hypothetical protein
MVISLGDGFFVGKPIEGGGNSKSNTNMQITERVAAPF